MITNGMAASTITTRWRKSSFSNSKGNCVEFARLADGQVGIRNSRHRSGPALVVDQGGLAAFIADTKAGRHDDLLTA